MKTKEYYGIGNDEYNYYKTVDNGKTWDFYRTKSKSKDDEEGKNKNESGSLIEKDNELIEEEKKDDGNVYFDIEDLLLDILNNIIIPKLSYMLSGKNDILSFSNGKVDNVTTFFTDNEVYKTTFNGIDFPIDVGMKPLTIEDLQEYKDIGKLENELYESMDTDKDIKEIELDEELEKNKILKTTFNILDLKLNRLREIILKHEVKKIDKADESYEGIPKEDIPTVKMFYNIRKGSEQSIVGTIINSIFTFNNNKKMALLKQSIMFVANNLKERINYRINTLTDIVESGSYNRDKLFKDEKFLNLFKFNLKEEWKDALNSSIKEYYSQAISNIYKISDSNDKNLISIASNRYHRYRQDMLDIASITIDNMNYNLKTDTLISKFIEDTNTSIDKFYNDVKTIVNSNINSSSSKIMDALKEYEDNEKERLSKLNNIYYKDINELTEYILRELNEKIDIDNESKVNDTFFFDDYDYEDLKPLSPLERNRVYRYYVDIVNEFKSRCVKVYSISTDRIIEEYKTDTLKISNQLSDWVNRLFKSSNFKIFVEENNLELLKEDNKDTCYEFNNVIKTIWKGLRNSI